MLTFNDFKEKQIVFIRSEDMGERVKFRNENLVLERNGKKNNQLSCHKILAVFILGNATITSNFIKQAASFGISVFLMNRNFYLYASIDASAEGNYLLREKQYASEKDFFMAKELVRNKILNQLKLLNSKGKISGYKERKKAVLQKVDRVSDEKALLGLEGSFGKEFFSRYFDEEEIAWHRRLPRVKPDQANLLLDMGYTFLFNYVDCLLRLYGFDVYRGFYHKFFFKRKSLSCDIMEPFRCLMDKAVLKIYTLKIYDKKDFKFKDGKFVLSWRQSKKYSQVFLDEIVAHKVEIFDYVFNFYRFMMKDGQKFPGFNPRFK